MASWPEWVADDLSSDDVRIRLLQAMTKSPGAWSKFAFAGHNLARLSCAFYLELRKRVARTASAPDG